MGELTLEPVHPRHRWTLGLVSILCVLAIAATACGKSSSNGGGTIAHHGCPHQPDPGRHHPAQGRAAASPSGLEAEQSGFNPASSSTRWDISGTEEGLAIYDPMAAFDASGNWKPYLAKSFVPNSDLHPVDRDHAVRA